LDTRPVDEVTDCVKNLDNLVKKHVSPMYTSRDAKTAVKKLQLAEQAWTHQAVCNKFGSAEGSPSLEEAAHETSILATSKEVAQYIIDVNEQIDRQASQKKQTTPQAVRATVSNTPSTSATPEVRGAHGESADPTPSPSPQSFHSKMCGTTSVTPTNNSMPNTRPYRPNKNLGNLSSWTEEDVSFLKNGLGGTSVTLSITNMCLFISGQSPPPSISGV